MPQLFGSSKECQVYEPCVEPFGTWEAEGWQLGNPHHLPALSPMISYSLQAAMSHWKCNTLSRSPPLSVMFANCHSKQTRLSYITWRTIVSLEKCPMWARFAIINCQPLLIWKHVLEHAMETLRICFVLSISTLSEPSYFTWIIVRALEKESFSVPNAGYSVWPQRRKHSTKPRITELLKSQSNWKRCLLKQKLWFKLQFKCSLHCFEQHLPLAVTCKIWKEDCHEL